MSFPKTPTFKLQPADTPASELAVRILVEFAGGETQVIGTALIVAGYLAITAKHNLDDIFERFGAEEVAKNQFEIRDYAVRLYQTAPGPNGPKYVIWNVVQAWPAPETDLAVLHLALHGQTDPDVPLQWRAPVLRAMPPQIGSAVVGFGYHSSMVNTVPIAGGGYHLDLNDQPTATTGEVEEILPNGQPSGRFTFPCFRVCARFDGGMSGGPVLDEAGAVCGIISGSYGNADGTPISYVATIWPILRTVISANRAGNPLRDVEYPLIDLALDGTIHVVGLEQLDQWRFAKRHLPGR